MTNAPTTTVEEKKTVALPQDTTPAATVVPVVEAPAVTEPAAVTK